MNVAVAALGVTVACAYTSTKSLMLNEENTDTTDAVACASTSPNALAIPEAVAAGGVTCARAS